MTASNRNDTANALQPRMCRQTGGGALGQRRQIGGQQQRRRHARDAQHRQRDEAAIGARVRRDERGHRGGHQELAESLRGHVGAGPTLRCRRARDERDGDPDEHAARHAGRRAHQRQHVAARQRRQRIDERKRDERDDGDKLQPRRFEQAAREARRQPHHQQFRGGDQRQR